MTPLKTTTSLQSDQNVSSPHLSHNSSSYQSTSAVRAQTEQHTRWPLLSIDGTDRWTVW